MTDTPIIPEDELAELKKVTTLKEIQDSTIIVINGRVIPIVSHNKVDIATTTDQSVIMTNHPGGYTLNYLLSKGKYSNDVRLLDKEKNAEYFL